MSLLATLARQSLAQFVIVYTEIFDGSAIPPEELDALMAFLESQADAYKLEDAALATDPRLWADICHVLFNAKEFLYVR
jgi:hypothetical protein